MTSVMFFITEGGKHRGIGVDAHPRQLEDSATDSYETPAGEGTNRTATETEAAREKSPASAATAKRKHQQTINKF